MAEPSSPLAACLTPPGNAAIAVVAVRGAGAWEAVSPLFRPRSGTLPAADRLRPGQFWLGRLGEGLADETILAVKRTAPAVWLEVHCHGGREVVAWLLELLEERGVRVCPWPELETRTAGDALRSLAAAELAQAPTVRTAAILLDQFNGAFARRVAAALDALRAGRDAEAADLLSGLARFDGLGRHLVRPWRVTVAGAVNAGKSSLVNALAGYQRSVVTPLPGTTRDVVTVRLALDGWPVELADTAGLRAEGEALEVQGMRLARDAASTADLCLWVLDASAEPLWSEAGGANLLPVINKTDLPAAWDLDRTAGAVRVSALTGTGVAALSDAIVARLIPEPSPAGAAVPFTAGLCDRIAAARAHLSANRPGDAATVLEAILTDPPA